MRTLHDIRLLPLAALVLAGFSTLGAAPAWAQLRAAPYAYGGLSVGQFRAQFDEGRMANSQLGLGLTSASVTSDDTGTAYRVFGGVHSEPEESP